MKVTIMMMKIMTKWSLPGCISCVSLHRHRLHYHYYYTSDITSVSRHDVQCQRVRYIYPLHVSMYELQWTRFVCVWPSKETKQQLSNGVKYLGHHHRPSRRSKPQSNHLSTCLFKVATTFLSSRSKHQFKRCADKSVQLRQSNEQ